MKIICTTNIIFKKMYKHKDEYVYDEMSKMVDSITEEKDNSPIYEDPEANAEKQTFQTIIQAININLQYLILSLPNDNILPEDSKYIHALCKRYMRVYEKTQSSALVPMVKVQRPCVFTNKVQNFHVLTPKVQSPAHLVQHSNSLLENPVSILQSPRSQKASMSSRRHRHRNTNTNWRKE